MPHDPNLDTPIARYVWRTRYKINEASIAETWQRVSHALATIEPTNANGWERRFRDILTDFQFLPGGRILAGAGSERDVTLLNCFVMGTIEDSVPGIFQALQEGAMTMQRGGGVGYDFSTIRPNGIPARTTGATASGPVSFLDVWDAMCATIQSTGTRRGAMMATLRCDHPDILAFIDAKRGAGRLSHFNLSVLVTDALMDAVERDETWPLIFPANHFQGDGDMLTREWPGEIGPVSCRVVSHISARALWDRLLRASYDCGEPGVLFIDRINRRNNLGYCETITATNPCGEVPLPPYGACDLASINLARLVLDPFTPRARLDTDRLSAIATAGVRLLDNVLDASRYPLPRQRVAALKARRIGLGITGLADALLMLGIGYGGDASLDFAGQVMASICHAAYRQSIAIAQEKPCFPDFDRERYLAAPFIQALPTDIRDGIARHGIRNSHLLAIAPTGSISLLAGNVSSGIEPIFAADYERAVLNPNGTLRHFPLTSYAVRHWRRQHDRADGAPAWLSTATNLPIVAHLAMQAALQPFVDNSISKTINVPADTSFADFALVYRLAYDKGLKGCTTFRPAGEKGIVLEPAGAQTHITHCSGTCE